MTVVGQRGFIDTMSTPIRPASVYLGHPDLYVGGVIVACPHSGRYYPPELISASRLDALTLRRSEDAFVDVLFQDAPTHGSVLLSNQFARAFVDVNRSPDELDPKLIVGIGPSEKEASSERVKAGLGVIPRTVGDGLLIYDQLISRELAMARLDEVHLPWHQAIETCLGQAKRANGVAILLDCHSMPSHAAGEPVYDVVLGDRFGVSCAPSIMNEAHVFLKERGLKVARNNPYAGGYTTRRHGQTLLGHHALQIEINRSLYMIEGAMTLRPGFDAIRQTMSQLVARLVGLSMRLGR